MHTNLILELGSFSIMKIFSVGMSIKSFLFAGDNDEAIPSSQAWKARKAPSPWSSWVHHRNSGISNMS